MKAIVQYLKCPDSGQHLEWSNGHLQCPTPPPRTFPSLNGIPWLVPDGMSALAQWKARAQSYRFDLQRQAERLHQEISNDQLGAITLKRLNQLLSGFKENLLTIERLLPDLVRAQSQLVESALVTKIPASQILSSYFDNIFRDWGWSNGENELARDMVLETLSDQQNLGRFVVLGCGAGRLAYDLHQECRSTWTLATDINPLLLTIAKMMANGEELKLFEFPRVPLKAENASVGQTLRAPQTARPEMYFLFADATRLPLVEKSVDTVLTPWLVDIIAQDLREFAAGLNQILDHGGSWVYFGPFGFEHRKYGRRYSQDEVLEIVKTAGFKVEKINGKKIPYLQSPHSGHGRLEYTCCFRAIKEKDVKAPKPFRYLPEWLTQHQLPIPELSDFVAFRTNSRVFADILAMVNGKRSINELADQMVQQYKMNREEALDALVPFLTSLYEKSLRGLN